MAIPSKKALVKVSGTAVAFTDEATTADAERKRYQTTDGAKRVWSPTATITVERDTGGGFSVVPTSDYSLSRLKGTVIFALQQPVGTVVRVDGQYLPMSTAAEAKAYTYGAAATNADSGIFGDTWVTRKQAGFDVTGTLSQWKTIDTYFQDALLAGTVVVLEFYSDSTQEPDLKVWALLNQLQLAAAVRGLVDQSVSWEGTLDADKRAVSWDESTPAAGLGIISEPAATTQLPDSQNWTTGWSDFGAGASFTPGQVLRLSSYGIRFTSAGVNALKQCIRNAHTMPSATMCYSVYWKRGTVPDASTRSIHINNQSAGGANVISVNFAANADGSPNITSLAGTWSSYAIGDGWYRIFGFSTTVPTIAQDYIFTIGTSGTGFDDFALPQLEQGRFPTSAIVHTGAGTASRAGDSLVRAGAVGFSGTSTSLLVRAMHLLHENGAATLHQMRDTVNSYFLYYSFPDGFNRIDHAAFAGGNFSGTGPTRSATARRKSMFSLRRDATSQFSDVAGQANGSGGASNGWSTGNELSLIGPGIFYEYGCYNSDIGAAAAQAADAADLPGGSFLSGSFNGQLPAGWTLTRSSSALDGDFVSRGNNVPRYAKEVF